MLRQLSRKRLEAFELRPSEQRIAPNAPEKIHTFRLVNTVTSGEDQQKHYAAQGN